MKTQFEKEAFKVAIAKLFKSDGYFSICDFENLLAMAGITLSTAQRRPFSAIHCIHYKEMSRELKESLIAEVAKILQQKRDPMLSAADALNGVVEVNFMPSSSELLRLVK